MTELADRYLDAFAAIEKQLRRLVEDDRRLTFYQLVDVAGRNVSVIRHYAVDLKEYADLRNALVHERGDGRPIAEPYVDTVAAIEAIRDVIARPPSLLAIVRPRHVEAAEVGEPIGVAVRRMAAHSFSQLPVKVEGAVAGLLTAEAIARWLAARLEYGIGLVEEEPVGEVMKEAEFTDTYRLVPRTMDVFEAIDLFTAASEQGRRLDALLITERGSPTERPLSIATPYDMPLLLRAARPFGR
jgi:hypothetical protein